MSRKRQLSETATTAPSAKRPRLARLQLAHDASSDHTSENSSPVEKSLDFSVVHTRRHWHGLRATTNMVVFGDSLTRYPSCRTWLSHFLQETNSHRKKQYRLSASSFAEPGNTVEDDIPEQITSFFSRYPPKVTVHSRPFLDPLKTLYVFWLGANDCGRTESEDMEDIIQVLFDALDDLYVKAGARNFLLVDVPPLDRSPNASDQSLDISEQFQTWNELLRSHAETFARETADASVLLFSSHSTVADILDDPEEYGFDADDAITEGGGIWMDELHLTSEVHAIIAERLGKALRGI